MVAHARPVFSAGIALLVASLSTVTPAAASPGWDWGARMTEGRQIYPMAVLPSGEVLVSSGRVSIVTPNVAGNERYDPATNTWSSAGSLNPARWRHTATVLASGNVLVTGGDAGLMNANVVSLADLYNPGTNSWSPAASMSVVRAQHTATLLSDGKVLVTGGQSSTFGSYWSSAERYDPALNSWSPAGSMPGVARGQHTATLLANGKVLVAGGRYYVNPDIFASAGAALYDPLNNQWSAADSLTTARCAHTATRLQDGRVLVVGGVTGTNVAITTAEIYDPGTDTWLPAGTHGDLGTEMHTATLLPNGEVLVVGSAQTLLFDPADNSWTPAPAPRAARKNASAVLLPNGRVLVAGGEGPANDALNSVELYTWDGIFSSSFDPAP